MKHAILCLLIFCFSLTGFFLEAKDGDFSVETTISSGSLDLNQQLTLQMILKYPSTYRPDIDSIQLGLVQNAGLYEPPFVVVRSEVHPPQETKETMTQQLDFIMSPQTLGKHYLSAGLIKFDPASKEGKKIFVASDMFTIDVGSPKVEVNLHSLIEPPMPFSTELPIVLSQSNRRAYIDNPHLIGEEAERNVEFIKSKVFPWLALAAALAVLLVIAFARFLPAKAVKYEADPLIKEKNEAQIKKELQRLTSSDPKEAGTFVTRLDFLIRRYLLNRYGFPAFSFTAQELEREINAQDEIALGLKEGMTEAFRAADQVKFARNVPSQDEVGKFVETARRLIENH